MVQLYVAEELVPLVAALAAVRASDGGLEAAERSVSPIRILSSTVTVTVRYTIHQPRAATRVGGGGPELLLGAGRSLWCQSYSPARSSHGILVLPSSLPYGTGKLQATATDFYFCHYTCMCYGVLAGALRQHRGRRTRAQWRAATISITKRAAAIATVEIRKLRAGSSALRKRRL
jgi:hypothetical protein